MGINVIPIWCIKKPMNKVPKSHISVCSEPRVEHRQGPWTHFYFNQYVYKSYNKSTNGRLLGSMYVSLSFCPNLKNYLHFDTITFLLRGIGHSSPFLLLSAQSHSQCGESTALINQGSNVEGNKEKERGERERLTHGWTLNLRAWLPALLYMDVIASVK